jgi:hypothetical protein
VRLNLLLFVGLLAAPLAWTAQLVVGEGIGEGGCSVAGVHWGTDTGAATAALFGGTAAIALVGLGVAVWLERSAARDGRGRVTFLAAGGVLVSLVFLTLIVLGGIAALSLTGCRPG